MDGRHAACRTWRCSPAAFGTRAQTVGARWGGPHRSGRSGGVHIPAYFKGSQAYRCLVAGGMSCAVRTPCTVHHAPFVASRGRPRPAAACCSLPRPAPAFRFRGLF
eukprot:649471-Prymnesium_polylepis.1